MFYAFKYKKGVITYDNIKKNKTGTLCSMFNVGGISI